MSERLEGYVPIYYDRPANAFFLDRKDAEREWAGQKLIHMREVGASDVLLQKRIEKAIGVIEAVDRDELKTFETCEKLADAVGILKGSHDLFYGWTTKPDEPAGATVQEPPKPERIVDKPPKRATPTGEVRGTEHETIFINGSVFNWGVEQRFYLPDGSYVWAAVPVRRTSSRVNGLLPERGGYDIAGWKDHK